MISTRAALESIVFNLYPKSKKREVENMDIHELSDVVSCTLDAYKKQRNISKKLRMSSKKTIKKFINSNIVSLNVEDLLVLHEEKEKKVYVKKKVKKKVEKKVKCRHWEVFNHKTKKCENPKCKKGEIWDNEKHKCTDDISSGSEVWSSIKWSDDESSSDSEGTPEPQPYKKGDLSRYERGIKKTNEKTFCTFLATTKFPEVKRLLFRKKIYDKLQKEFKELPTHLNLKKVFTKRMLSRMLELYDRYFFRGMLNKLSGKNGCKYVMCWEDRCEIVGFRDKGPAAQVTKNKDTEEIVFLFYHEPFETGAEIFSRSENKSTYVSGLICRDILECTQMIFEHEMIHSIMRCFCEKFGTVSSGPGIWKGTVSTYDHHSKTFMSIVNSLFGHTHYKHALIQDYAPTLKSIRKDDRERYREMMKLRSNFKVGDEVEFNYGMFIHTGKIVDLEEWEAEVKSGRRHFFVKYEEISLKSR